VGAVDLRSSALTRQGRAPSFGLDALPFLSTPAAGPGRTSKSRGRNNRVDRDFDVANIDQAKLEHDALLGEQVSARAGQKIHNLAFRRHSTVPVGISLASVTAGAAADQGCALSCPRAASASAWVGRDNINPTTPTRIRNLARAI
jgi:hypothetical protein